MLPALSKLLEKAVHSQLLEYLETNKLLNQSQFGCRANRSSQLATALLVDEIKEAGGNGKLVGALDLSKAFDTICHVNLDKLKTYAVIDIEIAWFTDCLFNRSQQVEIRKQKSTHFKVMWRTTRIYTGIFLLLFDDFPEKLSQAKCKGKKVRRKKRSQ